MGIYERSEVALDVGVASGSLSERRRWLAFGKGSEHVLVAGASSENRDYDIDLVTVLAPHLSCRFLPLCRSLLRVCALAGPSRQVDTFRGCSVLT